METINNLVNQITDTKQITNQGKDFDLDKLVEKLQEHAWVLIPGFIIDHHNMYIFKLLTAYFSGHKYFTDEGYDSAKGIYLKGPIGTGKTTLMVFFGTYIHKYGVEKSKSFLTTSTRDISKKYAVDGFKALEIYTKNSFQKKQTGYGETPITSKPIHRCFDDFGLEDSSSKFYGQTSNVMAEVILDRYELYKKYGMLTHFTTNLGGGDDVEAVYGNRVRSRLREMVNVIELYGDDRRK